jgi:hypothetical protein
MKKEKALIPEDISEIMSKAGKWSHIKSPRGRKFFEAMQKKRKYQKKSGKLSTKK